MIFCCGESLEQRDSGFYFDWIKSQIEESLFHLSEEEFSKIVIAYEPIWAIGTGVTASPSQEESSCLLDLSFQINMGMMFHQTVLFFMEEVVIQIM